ncbi:hypothetical protein ATX43_02660 [Oenococcus oeni]|nr:hypothetical protein X283_05775 [Oenococcus oeni IOEB_1491]OIL93969.1 hypothetical protein ATX43_02660 [Oenococcus oeni]OIL98160.1 hypothetical protein ATX44_09420 [Oenococcus oeni]
MKKRIYKKYRKYLDNYLGFNGDDKHYEYCKRLNSSSFQRELNHYCVLFDKRYKANEELNENNH